MLLPIHTGFKGDLFMKADNFAEERERIIMDCLNENGRVTVSQLVKLLGVSESTIRLQLQDMHERHLLVRTRGGAVKMDLPDGITRTNQELYTNIPNYTLKNEVAEIAASLVENGDLISIGSGSTAFLLATKIHSRKNLTVVTNSVLVAYELMNDRDIQVNICGGSILTRNGSCNGPFAEWYLNDVQVDKSFCGTDSVSMEKGFISLDADPRSERALCLCGNIRYMLADLTKFKKRPFIEKIVGFDEVHAVISNASLDADCRRQLAQNKVQIVTEIHKNHL